ncbi:MAG TPA: hypothetical protein VLI05_04265 [Candidatus Saccharimonadia bacterium]|nr:hypothetical protein [Candidatus Saccharimonadia bacterium]
MSTAEFSTTTHTSRRGDQVIIAGLSALLVPGTGYQRDHVRRVLDLGDVSRDDFAPPTWHVLSRLTAAEVIRRLDEPLRDYADNYWTDLGIQLSCLGPDGRALDEYSRCYGSQPSLVHGRVLVYPLEFWRPELEASDTWPEVDCRRLLQEHLLIEVDHQNPLPLSQLETHLAAGALAKIEELRRLLIVRPALTMAGFAVRGFQLRHLPPSPKPVDPEGWDIDAALASLDKR